MTMTDTPYIIEVNEQNFVSAVAQNSNRVPVFLDFYADWCAPCKILTPLLSKLAQEYQGKFIFAKVNSDEQKELAAQFAIKSLPTVKIVRNEKTIDEFQGAKTENGLREIIERVIDQEWNILHQQAVAEIHQGKIDDAINLLKKAYELQPNDLAIKTDLASILYQTDNIADANQLLDSFSTQEKQDSNVKSLLTRIGYQKIVASAPAKAELETIIENNPKDLTARHQLIANLVSLGEYEPALQHLLEAMKLEIKSKETKAQQALIEVFSLLGNNGDLVKRYRAKMYSILN
ncbi:hypothetical protein MNBD_GAMMA22-2668 [hydrothermal vent metagenome]|uniref:Thioredoxin domain-containing protein n=1 Tax=hydrothermal vent metagenome TaxID=652676 RepID=A0A3B0ZUW6_9ZZZZ